MSDKNQSVINSRIIQEIPKLEHTIILHPVKPYPRTPDPEVLGAHVMLANRRKIKVHMGSAKMRIATLLAHVSWLIAIPKTTSHIAIKELLAR